MEFTARFAWGNGMKYLAPIIAGLALVACDLAPSATGTDPASQAGHAPAMSDTLPDIPALNIEAHIRFLASNELAGRDTGSEGYQIAANYVAAQMRLLGLEPAGDDGSYFAQVPLQHIRADASYNQFTLDGVVYDQGESVYVQLNPSLAESEITGEVVFVGHGVSAPMHGHDDYAGLDVTGKIVAIIGGIPDGLPSEEAAHHRSATRDNAAAHGAIGVITLSSWDDEQTSAFANGPATSTSTRLTAASGRTNYDQLQVSAYVSTSLGAALFEGAEMSLEDVRAAMDAEEGASYPRFALPHTVTMRQRSISETFSDPNVVGMLRGSDPELAAEVVVLTAHLDHIGVAHAEGGGHGGGCQANDAGDEICNGALDNAAGVAVMLETARTFIQHGTPRRSVLFVALAGEEQGLLGSEHFARNPTVPAASIVANVNLDMPVIAYEFADVLAFGGEHSNLGLIAERAAARLGMPVSPDPIPEENIFVRSDHYSFVRQGIPSIMLATGFSSPDPRWDEGEGFMGFLQTHYHEPSDQLDGELEVLFDQGAKFANINYLIAREIADGDEGIAWNEGDFFGDLFGVARD
tara:strand:+ start:921 stop:2657 length:1737 start_codon:yes stop_codon:yes gene_type:complete